MPPDFVRYTPEIETVDPDLDRLLEQIIDFWEKKVRESPVVEGSGRAVRGAHAKTFGVVKAEVQILRNVPPAYAQGIYAKPGRHGALIRFSSASNHLGPDATLGGVLGCAMKIFDVPGSKLVEDEPDSDTFDLVLKNNPVFIANTAKHYLVLQEIGNDVPQYLARGKTGFHELLTDFVTGKGTFEQSDWAWDELFAFVKATQTPVRNPLLTTFWSMAAVRHGDYVAKIRLAPATENTTRVIHRELDLRGRPDVFYPTLVDELQASAFDFDLQVQLCTDLEAMPVNETTRRMAGKALSLRDGWTGTYPAPGHFGNRESREDGCARVQPVAGHRGAQAAWRNHAGATDLQRVSQGAPDAQSPAANRAHKCR